MELMWINNLNMLAVHVQVSVTEAVSKTVTNRNDRNNHDGQFHMISKGNDAEEIRRDVQRLGLPHALGHEIGPISWGSWLGQQPILRYVITSSVSSDPRRLVAVSD